MALTCSGIAAVALLASVALAAPAEGREHQRVKSACADKIAQLRERYGVAENSAKAKKAESGQLDVAVASWWGFDAGDATASLQAAIDSGASTVLVPRMNQPWTVKPIKLTRNDQTLLFEKGVLVRAKEGAFRGRTDCLFEARDQSGLTLVGYGAELRMRKRDYWKEPYRESQWRHGLSIRGCRDVKVFGLMINKTGGDGIYLGASKQRSVNENVIIRHVVCNDNHRQGISVITARDLLIEYCVLANTRGTAPMAGIDLEPNDPSQELTEVVIRNSMFLNNDIIGMHNYPGNLNAESPPVSVTWENNYVRGSEIGMHVGSVPADSPEGYIRFRNNIVEQSNHAGIMVRNNAAKSGIRVEFSGNVLRHTTQDRPYDEKTLELYPEQIGIKSPSQWYGGFPSAPILLHGQKSDPAVQGGVRFDGDTIIQKKKGPAVIVSGTGDEKQNEAFKRWSDVNGTLRVINPHGAWMQLRTEVSNFDLKINPVDIGLETTAAGDGS